MGDTDIDYRTWGATRTCKGCRHWSEMVARSVGGGPVQAMCLSALSPARGQYMGPNRTCTAWESGELGATDQPGGNAYGV